MRGEGEGGGGRGGYLGKESEERRHGRKEDEEGEEGLKGGEAEEGGVEAEDNGVEAGKGGRRGEVATNGRGGDAGQEIRKHKMNDDICRSKVVQGGGMGGRVRRRSVSKREEEADEGAENRNKLHMDIF
jgi:hypothetical protein